MPLSTCSKKAFGTRPVQALLLFLLFSAPILLTLSDYGITHDEPIYMEASRHLRQWLSLDLRTMFSKESIEQHWKTDPLRNVHPSGVKWLYVIAQGIVFWEKDPYVQNRLLCIFVFAASVTLFLRWNFGPSLAKSIFAILLLLSIPRFFAHAHFAATDIPMTAFLMLFVMGAKKSMDNGSTWLSGMLLGFLASIKITSLLIALPLLLLPVACSGQNWKKALFSASRICFLGAVAFYILNPDWWFSPLTRGTEFLAQSATRRTWAPLTVLFSGRFYSYRGPFYYPLAMFLITTPLLHILLLFAGLVSSFFLAGLRQDYKMALVVSCLFLPFIILALPMSPTIDGIRYLLPAYPFAACIMTQGLTKGWRWVRTPRLVLHPRTILRALLAAACLFLLVLDLHSPARCPPYELSYYNTLVGGVQGAFQKGYETTYWWEIFNEDAIRQVNKHTSGKPVYFPLLPTDLFFKHAMEEGKLGFFVVEDLREAEFILIFGRPNVSYWEKHTRSALKKEGKTISPVWEISIDSVPLLRLHKIQQIDR